MLVLSRRENEKVLFPSLGISVEVIKTHSRKVQLGIDAPREIRVIREELSESTEPVGLSRHGVELKGGELNGGANHQIDFDATQARSIRRDLDDASCAIVSAQSKLHMGMVEQADIVLEQALSILQDLESRFAEQPAAVAQVRESAAGYHVGSSPGDHVDSSATSSRVSLDSLVDGFIESIKQ